jgi:hypothetical protein
VPLSRCVDGHRRRPYFFFLLFLLTKNRYSFLVQTPRGLRHRDGPENVKETGGGEGLVLALPPPVLSASFTFKKGFRAKFAKERRARRGFAGIRNLFAPNFHVSAMKFWNAALPPVTLRASSPLRKLRAKCFFDLCLRQRSKPLRLCGLLAAGTRRTLNQRLKCRIFFAILHLGSLTLCVRHPKILGQNCRA